MIQPLNTLDREAEGAVLRGLLGMLVKRRTADADRLEISDRGVADFLKRYTVGVTHDGIAGVYMILVQQRPQDGGKTSTGRPFPVVG